MDKTPPEGHSASFERVVTEKNWPYPRLETYLLKHSASRAEQLPLSQQPESLSMNEYWHSYLENMRKDTLDGRERGGVIGFRPTRDELLFSRYLIVGTKNQISGIAIWQKMKEMATLTQLETIGVVHSHPQNKDGTFGVNFSTADLLGILDPKRNHGIEVLIADKTVSILVSTQDTTQVTHDLLEKDFRKFWIGEIKRKNPNARGHEFAERIMLAVVEEHRLALFQGKLGEPLKRVHPHLA